MENYKGLETVLLWDPEKTKIGSGKTHLQLWRYR